MVVDHLRLVVFISSCLGFSTIFGLTKSRFRTQKQTAWIITTAASICMTAFSLPYLWDYLTIRGNVQHLQSFDILSRFVTTFFQAYLVTDLLLGNVYYRSQIGLLTGWIHHLLYIIIVEYALSSSWPHIFCLAAIMELPTFILGLGTLFPQLRSNTLFALTFFTTRICFHIVLGVSYAVPENRYIATGGSWMPATILAMIFPLHASWFHGCVKGFIRRRASAASAAAASIDSIDITDKLGSTNPKEEFTPTTSTTNMAMTVAPLVFIPSSSYTRHPLPTIPEHPPVRLLRIQRPSYYYNHYRHRLTQRRRSIAYALRYSRRWVYESIPTGKRIYDVLGIGRQQAGNETIVVDVDSKDASLEL